MAVTNPPEWLQAGSHPAENARRLTHALVDGRGGIVSPGDLAVAENGTPNMSVNVAAGRVLVPGTEATFQGIYRCESRATENRAISAADATNPRKDLVVARVKDAAYSGATNSWDLEVVTGTPAPSPSEPAIPANSWVLAMVDVPANDTAITNSQITDRRTTQTGQFGRAAALGGVIVCTSTTRPSHVVGRFIYETDTKRVLASDGTNWLDPQNLLALALSSEYGKKTVTGSGSGTISAANNVDVAITFGFTFPANPKVFAHISSASASGNFGTRVKSATISTTGCTINVFRTDGTTGTNSIAFDWWAIG